MEVAVLIDTAERLREVARERGLFMREKGRKLEVVVFRKDPQKTAILAMLSAVAHWHDFYLLIGKDSPKHLGYVLAWNTDLL